MVLPSPLITIEAQARILDAKSCALYLRPTSMATYVDSILKEAPHVQAITVPEIDEFMKETEAPTYVYPKSWEKGKSDPWLVFHTSGTTGSSFIQISSSVYTKPQCRLSKATDVYSGDDGHGRRYGSNPGSRGMFRPPLCPKKTIHSTTIFACALSCLCIPPKLY
jgi:hypothetical protein